MLLPLGLLGLGAVMAGFTFHEAFINDAAFWNGAVFFDEHLIHAMHEVPLWVKLSASVVMLIGLFIAWSAYIRDTSIPVRFVATFPSVHAFAFNKWYFDELYHFLFVRPAFWLGRLFWQKGDVGIIDRFGPDGAAWAVALGSTYAKKIQSGYLTSYALIMLLGLVAAVSWAMVH